MVVTRMRAGRPMRIAVMLACLAGAAYVTDERAAVRRAVAVTPRGAGERALALAASLDVWSDDPAANPLVVVLSPSGIAMLEVQGVQHRVVVDDIDAIAEAERGRLAHRSAADWFAEYRDVREVSDYMDELAARHPGLATVRELGTSLEGQSIRALEISRGGTLTIVLDGAHHAREWISVMVPICIADRLVRRADSDTRIRRILETVRFFIVPIVNPDGYRYSWTVDRYWRKNRRGDHGVDLNRNYSVAWGDAGSSMDPRSPNYRGEHAFSEPETRALQALFARERVAAHVDFHSFSQVIVYPWSHQRTPPPDRDRLAGIADRMATAIHAAHGETYAIRPGSELSVGAGGTATDWSYGEHGALSFIVELRPARGPGGFVLPPEQIVPTCDEGLASVLALAESMIRH
jgi:carboxypeptidase T